jgi:hypothetical protein
MLGDTAEWKQRHGIREGPTPTIEADDALELGNRLALDRLAVEGGFTETLEALSAARSLPLISHYLKNTTVRLRSQLVGIVESVDSLWNWGRCNTGRSHHE